MRRALAGIATTIAVVGTSLVAGAMQSSASPPAAPTPAPAPAAGSAGGVASLNGTASAGSTSATPETSSDAAAAAALCFFTTNGDYVHVSSSAFEASGHGWWVNGDCPTSTAVVTVQLQEYYSDGTWRNKGTVGRSTVRSGGGAGNRATGRAGCNTSAVVGWRSVVDVDLVGVADSPDKLITPARNIPCLRN